MKYIFGQLRYNFDNRDVGIIEVMRKTCITAPGHHQTVHIHKYLLYGN